MGGQFLIAPYSPEVGNYSSDGSLWVRHNQTDGNSYYKYQMEPGRNWIPNWLRE
jgi:hypothetical protein